MRVSPVCAVTDARFLPDHRDHLRLALRDRLVLESFERRFREARECGLLGGCCEPFVPCHCCCEPFVPCRCCGEPFVPCHCYCEPFEPFCCCGPFDCCGPCGGCRPLECSERSIDSVLLARAKAGVLTRMQTFDWQIVHGRRVAGGDYVGGFLDVIV